MKTKYILLLALIFSLMGCQSKEASDIIKNTGDTGGASGGGTTGGSGGTAGGGGGGVSCPSGYVLVPANAAVDVASPFCVMEVEARNNGGLPGTNPLSSPWTNITQTAARAACDALDPVTHKYALISNPEWMALARNIEAQGENWSSGIAGSGCLKAGNSGADTLCLYNHNTFTIDFGALSSRNSKASHVLSNGSVVWDLGANLQEWVDWNVPNNKLYLSDYAGPVHWATIGYSDLGARGVFPNNVMPVKTWRPTYYTLDIDEGMSDYVSGYEGTGGAALRGAHYAFQFRAGIYHLDLGNEPSISDAYRGFRCTYHP